MTDKSKTPRMPSANPNPYNPKHHLIEELRVIAEQVDEVGKLSSDHATIKLSKSVAVLALTLAEVVRVVG